MADKETGILIDVIAVVDEASAEQAGKDLNAKVLNSLKDGHITIPAAVEADFKSGRASQELRKAQKEFIEQWKKMSSEGFSSSDGLEDLYKKYQQYSKLLKKEDPKAEMKQHAALKNSELNTLLKNYNKTQKELNKKIKAISKVEAPEVKVKETTKKSTKTPTKTPTKKPTKKVSREEDKFNPDLGPMSQEEMEVQQKRHKAEYNNTKGIRDLAKEMEARNERKLSSTAWSDIDPHKLRLSDMGGAHGSRLAAQQQETLKESYKLGKKTYRRRINKDEAEQRADEAHEKIKGRGRPKEFYDKETREDKSKHTLTDVAKIGAGLAKGREDVTPDTLKDTIANAITDQLVTSKYEEMPVKMTNAINAIKNMATAKQDSNGYIGINYEDEEGVNVEEWKATMKDVLKGLAEIDMTALQTTFDKIRKPIAETLKNIRLQEREIDRQLTAINKQLQANMKDIGYVDNYFKFNKKYVSRTKQQMEEVEAELAKAMKQKAQIDKEYSSPETQEKISKLQSIRAEKAEQLQKSRDVEIELRAPKISEEKQTELTNKKADIDKLIKEIAAKEITAEADLGDIREKKFENKQTIETLIAKKAQIKDAGKKTWNNIFKTLPGIIASKLAGKPAKTRTKNEELTALARELQTTKAELAKEYEKTSEQLTDTSIYDAVNKQIRDSLNPIAKTESTQLVQDVTDDARESISDEKQLRAEEQEVDTTDLAVTAITSDADTGLNTDEKADTLIGKEVANSKINAQSNVLLEKILAALQTPINAEKPIKPVGDVSVETEQEGSYTSVLDKIKNTLSNVALNVRNISQSVTGMSFSDKDDNRDNSGNKMLMVAKEVSRLPDLFRTWIDGKWGPTGVVDHKVEDKRPTVYHDKTNERELTAKARLAYDETERDEIIKRNAKKKQEEDTRTHVFSNTPIDSSKVTTSALGLFGKLKDTLTNLTWSKSAADKILEMNRDERDRARAERVDKFGLNRGRNLSDTGDKANMDYRRSLFGRFGKFGRGFTGGKDLFKDIELTPGIEVDTSKILSKMNKALSGAEMFKAQTGGGLLRNALGAMTGYIGMPSLEKSRARVDGLNQIFADVRNQVLKLIQDIQADESTLRGMEQTGTAKIVDGKMTDDSSAEAKKTFVDLEERKQLLKTALAEVGMIDQIIDKSGGKVDKIVKRIGFLMPELMKDNVILQNINAGLDKNGKALKFQSRTAEVLGYTFQLMARSVGQMWKNWMIQLNPITQIKKALNDFMGYDVKWKRTMSVIKYNLQSIIRPFMEWIAQQLVNVLGVVDIISQKIQSALGMIPRSLFDQSAANAEKMRRELEEAANVTAGFDELHDIGSNNSGENDLLGDIYKPQLSKEWEDWANKVGDIFAGIISGDMGFGEFMKKLLGVVLEGLGNIARAFWDWFRDTSFGKFLTEHWKGILATMLAAFVGWQLLKIAGNALFNALFGKLTSGAITNVFGKVGSWILGALNLTSVGSGIALAFQTLFAGGKYSLLGTIGEMFTNSAAITEAGSWGSMIGFAIAKALVGTVSIALGGKMLTDAFDSSADKASYNIGLMNNGGDEKDKKGNGWDIAKGAAGGAAIGFGVGQIIPVIGPVIGAAVGALAGAITTALAPAFESAAVTAKDLNNEMQKIEYYEGAVQGASSQVNVFQEQLDLLKQSLDINTQSVYAHGAELGISKSRMEELVKATQDGTFTTSMLSGKEIELSSSLTDLAQKQEHVTEVSGKLEEAQRKLLKAQTELSIAQDVEAGNFELAAARIEVAEAQGVYTADEATKKRIQIYKQGGEEERKNLLQNLTPEQRKLMMNFNDATDKELAELAKLWRKSSEDTKASLLAGVDADTQKKFKEEMDRIDQEIKSHQSFWSGVGDTLKEIFTFGQAKTWTYNGEEKYYDDKKKGKLSVAHMAIGTNYVPMDGLAYLHQGEAVIPAKYNQPYQQQGLSPEEKAYMEQMMSTLNRLDETMNQGINVKGQFVQRGSDLVATVQKNDTRLSNNVLNNKVYAR